MTIEQEFIKFKYDKLIDTIRKTNQQINKLQKFCNHPDKDYTIGYHEFYDPKIAENYWMDFYCPDCKKKWAESIEKMPSPNYKFGFD